MSHFFVFVRSLREWLLPGLSCLALAGCSAFTSSHSADDKTRFALPQQQVADFLAVECADIWALQNEVSDKNPLYWLRGIDCAERLAPEQARAEARRHNDDSWQDAFKRGILLGDARITPDERRDMLARLDSFSVQIDPQIRPLYQLWRDAQDRQIQLIDQRSRYARLQQSSDTELEALRQQEQALRSQLELTTRKLENLTDIERRLSSRKPGGNFNSEGGHGGDKVPEVIHDDP
ncbi:two-component system QseEF-associated lipoprotein QseG [Klebsiella indica]|uniref:Two-component system QseEF-associated lipoprotein QseG n=1 Tax=Klebsiella indica TaxID=2582917 RepID=A0A5R9LHN9_9ENTR|nr:two-component system QseEF-associated lipoprotein QseG [Klebsiella indica]TLV17490.1 two-component system QseEF-associated lipoprotein QseG [Klebsiella indica]